jgi:DMSO/TMAO reductase YedYZ molybdopterin-dependent catalytic subunit
VSEMDTLDPESRMRRLSRRSFLWGGAALAGAYAGWQWLITRRPDGGVPWPLRRTLEMNEQLNRDYFQPARLSTVYPVSAAGEPRTNGDIGMEEELDPGAWALKVEGVAGAPGPITLRMDAIRSLPKVDVVTELRCIEGWSQVVHWSGARLSDFIAKHPPVTQSGNPARVDRPDDMPEYVGLATPDGGYYVGLDMPAALHPQTLLCYEMNGQPLTADHGAPLRLVIPVRYGVKNIKRIGMIRYVQQRPPDYWAEQGYDWYAGL